MKFMIISIIINNILFKSKENIEKENTYREIFKKKGKKKEKNGENNRGFRNKKN